jgi:hypothetical protein
MVAERPGKWSHKKLSAARKRLNKHYRVNGYASDHRGNVGGGIFHAVRPEAIYTSELQPAVFQ